MGVKGLWSLLSPASHATKLETLRTRRLAIDASIWLHQFLKAMRDRNGNAVHAAHLVGFFRRICKLLFYGVLPVFVFDGATPSIKRLTIANRRHRREVVQHNLRKTAERLLSARLRKQVLDAATRQDQTQHPHRSADVLDDVPKDAEYYDPVTNTTKPAAAKDTGGKPRRVLDEYELPSHANGAELNLPIFDTRLATEEELQSFISTHRNDIDLTQINIDSKEFQSLPIQLQHELILDLKHKARAPNRERVDTMMRGSTSAIEFSRAQIKNLVHRNALTERTMKLAQTGGVVKNPAAQKLAAMLQRRRGGGRRVVGMRDRNFVLIKNDDVGGAHRGGDGVGGWTMVAREQATRVVDGLRGMQGFGSANTSAHSTNGTDTGIDQEALAEKDNHDDDDDDVNRNRKPGKPRHAIVLDDDDDDNDINGSVWSDVTTHADDTAQADTTTVAPQHKRPLIFDEHAYVDDDDSVESVVARIEEMERRKRVRSSDDTHPVDDTAMNGLNLSLPHTQQHHALDADKPYDHSQTGADRRVGELTVSPSARLDKWISTTSTTHGSKTENDMDRVSDSETVESIMARFANIENTVTDQPNDHLAYHQQRQNHNGVLTNTGVGVTPVLCVQGSNGHVFVDDGVLDEDIATEFHALNAHVGAGGVNGGESSRLSTLPTFARAGDVSSRNSPNAADGVGNAGSDHMAEQGKLESSLSMDMNLASKHESTNVTGVKKHAPHATLSSPAFQTPHKTPDHDSYQHLSDTEFLSSWSALAPTTLHSSSIGNVSAPDTPKDGWFSPSIFTYTHDRITHLLEWTDRRRGKSTLGSDLDVSLAFLQRYLLSLHERTTARVSHRDSPKPWHSEPVTRQSVSPTSKRDRQNDVTRECTDAQSEPLHDATRVSASLVVKQEVKVTPGRVSTPLTVSAHQHPSDISAFLTFDDDDVDDHGKGCRDTSMGMDTHHDGRVEPVSLENAETQFKIENDIPVKASLPSCEENGQVVSVDVAIPVDNDNDDDDDDEDNMVWETVEHVVLDDDEADDHLEQQTRQPLEIVSSPTIQKEMVEGDDDAQEVIDILDVDDAEAEIADAQQQEHILLLEDEQDEGDTGIDVPVQMDDEMAGFAAFVHDLSAARSDPAAAKITATQLQDELSGLEKQHRREQRDASDITSAMIHETQELLRLFGLPYIVAATEAESQCAYLLEKGLVDGIVTDDSDVFLFGGRVVYKNMFNKSKYVEMYTMEKIEQTTSLTRERLIQLAYLLGSDYTPGLVGVGPVRSLEILNEWCTGADNDTLTGFSAFRQWAEHVANGVLDPSDTPMRKRLRDFARKLDIPQSFPDPRVMEAYMHPQVDDDATEFTWGEPSVDAIRDMLQDKLRWSQTEIDAVLIPVVVEMNRMKFSRDRNGGLHQQQQQQKQQATLNQFFSDLSAPLEPPTEHKSARVRNILKKWTNGDSGSREKTSDGADPPAETQSTTQKSTRKKSVQNKAAVSGRGKSHHRGRRGGRTSSTTKRRGASVHLDDGD